MKSLKVIKARNIVFLENFERQNLWDGSIPSKAENDGVYHFLSFFPGNEPVLPGNNVESTRINERIEGQDNVLGRDLHSDILTTINTVQHNLMAEL
jgi:hypothetical protein